MPAQRYLKITQLDGKRYILRVTKESPRFIHGLEVDAQGDEIVPPGFHNRHRSIERTSIKKAVEMHMNNTYATLEATPRNVKTRAQLDAEITEALAKKDVT